MGIDAVKIILAGSKGGPLYFFAKHEKHETLYREFEKSKWCKNSNGYYYNLSREAKEKLGV